LASASINALLAINILKAASIYLADLNFTPSYSLGFAGDFEFESSADLLV